MQSDQIPSPRIFGKHHGARESCGCGDNRGGVCLDGATSFVKCQARPRLALNGQSDRTRVCPLSDDGEQEWDFHPGQFVR